jgi:outer membrane protein TolC
VNLTQPPALTGLPPNEETATAIGLEENPQIVAAVFQEQASKFDIRAVSGALLPSVSLTGSITRTSEAAVTPDLQTTTGQIIAGISIPLYEAGNVYSQVRQRRQINSQRIVQIEESRRLIRQNIIQAWENLNTARANIVARNAQVSASTVALDGVNQEAQVGSRTTLDVLDAEQELLDASVALVRAQRDEFVAAYTLQSAIGRLTARQLALPVQLYDPAENYSRVREKWLGTDGGLD